jgi:Small-conductance mechanosensitive channel
MYHILNDEYRSQTTDQLMFVGQLVLVCAALLWLARVWQPAAAQAPEIFGLSFQFGTDILLTVLLLVGGLVGVKGLKQAADHFAATRAGITEHQTEVLYRIVQLGIFGFILTTIVNIWGYNLGGFILGAGFLGIVLGMAARRTLGTALAGFVLMFSRPFEVGDWVEIGDEGGTVTDIAMMNTRIRTAHGEELVVPSDRVREATIINKDWQGALRLEASIGIDHKADIARAIAIAEDALTDLETVSADQPPKVVVESYDSYGASMNLKFLFWIDSPTYDRKLETRSDVITAVTDTFVDHDIDFAYPMRLPVDGDGKPQAGGTGEFDVPTPSQVK